MIDLTHVSLETTAAEVAYRHRVPADTAAARYAVRPRRHWGARRRRTESAA